MKVLGIIAEYDPFHLGHERHLRLAREAVQPDETLIVLSGCFRQRGDPALLSPRDRAACALQAGADAVFSLPVMHTVRSAEDYAFAAVSLLSSLGCTHLAFGAETDRADLLESAAAFLEDPPEAFRSALRAAMESGAGYPRALEEALSGAASPSGMAFTPETARMISLPNNTLAVCYLRAIRRLSSPLKPVLIPRSGQYRADLIDPVSPSASAVRSALCRGGWSEALAALPEYSASVVRNAFLQNRVFREEALDALLLARLRGISPEEAASLPDLSEGLENRLRKEAVCAFTREELLRCVCSRRYSRARVSRLCACALLGIRQEDFSAAAAGPGEALLLALRPNQAMTARWRSLPLRILSSLSETKNPPLWRADLRAWKIWAQCAGLPDTLPYSERIVTPDRP